MKQFIKDMHTKQFSVNDMVEFAVAMEEKPNFDESSVEIWFNKKQARLQRLLDATKSKDNYTGGGI